MHDFLPLVQHLKGLGHVIKPLIAEREFKPLPTRGRQAAHDPRRHDVRRHPRHALRYLRIPAPSGVRMVGCIFKFADVRQLEISDSFPPCFPITPSGLEGLHAHDKLATVRKALALDSIITGLGQGIS